MLHVRYVMLRHEYKKNHHSMQTTILLSNMQKCLLIFFNRIWCILLCTFLQQCLLVSDTRVILDMI